MNLLHLKQQLVEKNKTQADMARLLGRDKSAITNLLKGKRELKAQEVILLAEFLDLTVGQVLGVEKIPTKKSTASRRSDRLEQAAQERMIWSYRREAEPVEVINEVVNDATAVAAMIPFCTPPFIQNQPQPAYHLQDGGWMFIDVNIATTADRVAFEVPDQSLDLEGFMAGDLVIASRGRRPVSSEIVIVTITTGEVTRWTLRKYQPPFLRCHSTRDGFEQLHEERANVAIIATVEKLIRYCSSSIG